MIESDEEVPSSEVTLSETSPSKISGDPVKSTNKRQRQLSSDEEELLTKKSRKSTEEQSPPSNGNITKLETDDVENDAKKEIQDTNLSTNEESISSSTSMLKDHSVSMAQEKEENNESSSQDKDNNTKETNDNDSHNIAIKSEISDTSEKSVACENTESVPEHKPEGGDESIKENTNLNVTKSSTKDIEVVDGLELSVECASDKEESSSESDHNNDDKPRKKTIIVKAKPNESELDVSSSEKEQTSGQNNLHTKKNLKQGKLKINKKKFSDSEGSSYSGLNDEDKKQQNKRKSKRSPNKKDSKSLSETKKDRNTQKNNIKKQDKNLNNDDDEDDTLINSDIERDINRVIKSVDEDEDEERTSSASETSNSGSESDDDDDDNLDKSKDSKKRKRGSAKPEDDKRIQALKKYIRAAGITVKSYQELWSGCKTNAARIRQLKSLLEEHGVTGRPTLEKCKKIRKRNESLKEVSELDKSNIISEGRVTRSRRNMDSNKNTIISPETPRRHRETRSSYKRIKTVIDSDSE